MFLRRFPDRDTHEAWFGSPIPKLQISFWTTSDRSDSSPFSIALISIPHRMATRNRPRHLALKVREIFPNMNNPKTRTEYSV
jgi:hypothetical protein